ncbi:TRAP transporter large permease subunit [Acaryochloris marina]|uniref:TRAP transporter large permease n=1 Tax=Acaryochloris marina TaxID=155978 RepID=UPI002016D809|nr:TRAP transporter large permease subunit [Acaryochloris marina]QUY44381.1 TRAP transporter large permease subunit [Acaryochloris marina S15]
MAEGGFGLLMFAGALALLSLGYPVAFSLGGVAIGFGFIGVGFGVFDPIFLTALPYRIYGIMENYTLLAIPYFIFLGAMLDKTGIAKRLLETIGLLLGRVRGGLAIAIILVGALLAASTGVVAATVVMMGLISMPIMLEHGYSKELAAGVIVASGTLGQIIPPSLVLIVLGDQLGISVGDLFMGSVIPGLMMVGAFVGHVLLMVHLKPEMAPALPPEASKVNRIWLRQQVLRAVLPPLFLIILVLGSIFFGIATPTEAGAVGCIGTMVLAQAYGQLNGPALQEVCQSTLRFTCMVIFILIGSTAFSLVFRGLQGDRLLFDLLVNLPGGKIGFLLVNMLVIFLLGFFIDFFEIAFILMPIFAPVAESLGLDLVWYGVVIGANLQTSFLTPPFGFALFFLRGVAPPEVTTQDIYRGAIPFICVQLIILALIIIFPSTVTFLPSTLS